MYQQHVALNQVWISYLLCDFLPLHHLVNNSRNERVKGDELPQNNVTLSGFCYVCGTVLTCLVLYNTEAIKAKRTDLSGLPRHCWLISKAYFQEMHLIACQWEAVYCLSVINWFPFFLWKKGGSSLRRALHSCCWHAVPFTGSQIRMHFPLFHGRCSASLLLCSSFTSDMESALQQLDTLAQARSEPKQLHAEGI